MSTLIGSIPDVTSVIQDGIAANFKKAISARLREVAEVEIEAIATELAELVYGK